MFCLIKFAHGCVEQNISLFIVILNYCILLMKIELYIH